MARLDLTFGQPATSQVTQATAPTAAPFRSTTSKFSQDQVQNFNNLLTGLLTKSQTIPEEGYNQRSTNLQKAALDRASAITPTDQRGLSPSQQSSIRSAQVSAVEQPLQTAEQQRTAFQGKIEKLPSLLSSLSDFSKAFEDEGQKLISHTFKEDASGNVTWVGVMQNPDGTFEQVSEDMGGIGTPSKASGTSGGTGGVGGTPSSKVLTPAQANTYGVPAGSTEEDIKGMIAGELPEQPPMWFINQENNKAKISLSPTELQKRWDAYKSSKEKKTNSNTLDFNNL
jgi:hypothetical protein